MKSYIETLKRPKLPRLLGQPSYGMPQLGYWLLRSRFRIPRGHRLVSVVVVPYSDPFLEASSRGIFPRRFLPRVTATQRPPSDTYIHCEIAKCHKLANRNLL